MTLLLMAAATMGLTGCAQKKADPAQPAAAAGSSKTLVAYYSATGHTERTARVIAEVTGGRLYEIRPEQVYSDADLDWTDKQSRSSREHADASARPAIANNPADVAPYDTVFVGFPVWWDEAPRVINTFVEACNLEGKVLIPFATSGGSGIGPSVAALRKAYPNLNWQEGRLLNAASPDDVRSWLGL